MKLKRGITRKDGKIFWCMRNKKEYWVCKEQYLRLNEASRIRSERYRKKNPETFKEVNKRWRKNNRDKINSYNKIRRKHDFLYRMRHQVSTNIREAFRSRSFSKDLDAETILGCSFEEFKAHLESQFLPGMSWENRSEWHLDHIMPVSMAKTYDELLRLNHYRNFRPMWAIENMKKSNKTPDTLVLF